MAAGAAPGTPSVPAKRPGNERHRSAASAPARVLVNLYGHLPVDGCLSVGPPVRREAKLLFSAVGWTYLGGAFFDFCAARLYLAKRALCISAQTNLIVVPRLHILSSAVFIT